jgi:hypothetical protein
LPVLTVLAACNRPQAVEWIQRFSSVDENRSLHQLEVKGFLDEIAQFLIESVEEIPTGRTVTTYRIYHTDFRDFLNTRAELYDQAGIQEKIRGNVAMLQMRRYINDKPQ